MIRTIPICASCCVGRHFACLGCGCRHDQRGITRILFFAIAALFAVAFAHPSFANNFRVADQIILPAIGSAITPWASYQSRVTVRNDTGDNVSVSVTFRPYGAQSVPIEKNDVIKLGPHQQCEWGDFLGAAAPDKEHPECKVLSPFNVSAFGFAIFSGCLDGADCGGFTGQPGPAIANYRNISVQSRIYLFATGADEGSSVGQNMPGLPWWSFGDQRNPLRITGIAVSDQYRTNLVFVNGSPYSEVTLMVSLYDGASGALRDVNYVHLNPNESEQIGVLSLFPKFGDWARQNPTRVATNAYVEITTSGVVPTPSAASFGCADGCPSVFAVGSMIAKGNDPTTLEATFVRGLTDAQIATLFGPSAFAIAAPTMPGALSERSQAIANVYQTQTTLQGLAVKVTAAKAKATTVK